MGALVRSLEEVPDADTPTAAALARAHGGSGLFHSSSSSMDPASSYPASGAAAAAAAPLPPPPPPPRPAASGGSGSWGAVAAAITDNSAGSYSSGGAAAPAPGGYEAELNAVFIGDASWGGEPVWYYIDRSDQVQGPFSAREMIAWVSSSMLKEDTKMCGAEAKLGVSAGLLCITLILLLLVLHPAQEWGGVFGGRLMCLVSGLLGSGCVQSVCICTVAWGCMRVSCLVCSAAAQGLLFGVCSSSKGTRCAVGKPSRCLEQSQSWGCLAGMPFSPGVCFRLPSLSNIVFLTGVLLIAVIVLSEAESLKTQCVTKQADNDKHTMLGLGQTRQKDKVCAFPMH